MSSFAFPTWLHWKKQKILLFAYFNARIVPRIFWLLSAKIGKIFTLQNAATSYCIYFFQRAQHKWLSLPRCTINTFPRNELLKLSFMLLTSSVIANIVELSLKFGNKKSLGQVSYSVVKQLKDFTQTKSLYLFHSLDKLFWGFKDAFVCNRLRLMK